MAHSSNKKRILIAIRSLERGGTEIHLLRALSMVQHDDFCISVFCYEHPGELAVEMRAAGISVVTPPLAVRTGGLPFFLKPFAAAWSALWFLGYLFVRNPHLVHFYLPAAYLLLGPVSLLHPFSVKVMSRRSLNHYQDKYPAFVRRLEMMLHRQMARILANSRRVLEQLRDVEHVSDDILTLIHNGVDTGPVDGNAGALRYDLGLADDCLLVTMVANLIPYKGHADVIEACAILLEDRPDLPAWRLILAGNDTAHIRDQLGSLAIARGVAGHVHFLGKRDDVPAILAQSDIALLTSHEEGFSNAVLEGMAAGLPMIVSNVGGNGEAVIHEETGLIVPPRSPERIAHAMEQLLTDKALRQRYGQAGRTRVETCFSNRQSVEAYRGLYLSLTA